MIQVYGRHIRPIPETESDLKVKSGEVQENNQVVSQETLLFEIPIQNGAQRPFLSAVVNDEMGKAGSFEFSVDPKSKLYDIWYHMRSLIRVNYDGDTIFYGRVLTIDRDMFRVKKIHCEGAYTFFMDSLFEGTKNGFTITLTEFLEKLITAHNRCMDDAPEKKIQLGEVPGHYSASITTVQRIVSDTQKFANSQGYKTVKEWLDGLVNDYGGCMRVRYNNGTLYLDWLKTYYNATENNQTLSVNSNVVDLSDTVEVNNIFTHVVPVGKDNKYIDGTSTYGTNTGGGGGGGGTDPDAGDWAVNIYTEGGGTAAANFTKASKGWIVTLTVTPGKGHWFKEWRYGSPDVVIQSNNSFVMPDHAVSLTAVFEDKDGHEGGIDQGDPGTVEP